MLVVDDTSQVRKLITDILTYDGHEVLVGESAGEGFTTFQANAQSIDLVIMDEATPGLSAAAVVECMRKINPTVPVLYISAAAPPKHLGPYDQYLPKPFDVSELLGAIRELLENT